MIESIFDLRNRLSEILPSYEFRKEQRDMSSFIMERLYASENGVIEAGTGTGKTLAYLVPAIQYCLEQDKRMAVSTETKTLQKQLIDNDIPIAREIFSRCFNMDFSFSLCLGGSNYPCRMRFEAALMGGKVHAGDLDKLQRIGRLFHQKEIFTNVDLNLPGYLWDEIKREGDSCNVSRCPLASECIFQRAKREWSQSHLLVMNHYLLFANIASGKTYLPPFDIVIFDEAHSIEEIAASQLGFNLGRQELMDIVNRFSLDAKQGLLPHIIRNESFRTKCADSVERAVPAIISFFEDMRRLMPEGKSSLRLREAPAYGSRLIGPLKECMTLLAEADQGLDDGDPRRIDFDIARGRLFTYIENLSSFVFHYDENYVYWIERASETRDGALSLKGQPVDVSEILNREIVNCYDSSIFVSATLAVSGDFSYIVRRLGIENHATRLLGSSFNYKNQAVLYIAGELAPPNDEEYSEQASAHAAEIVKHLKGNCLMLFTSYKTLREVRKIITRLIEYSVYSQDVSTATEALEHYLKDDNAVLMGTHSFWQGLDLPGDLLRGIIMMKLPFAVPDSPPVEARMERITAEGKDPFYAYQIPEAVIRFKQGFGRLIRSSTDRGIVAVLDSRILRKSYGKYFLASVPECRVVHSLQELKQVFP
jgi:ATP-dependent DNA helicase DinG